MSASPILHFQAPKEPFTEVPKPLADDVSSTGEPDFAVFQPSTGSILSHSSIGRGDLARIERKIDMLRAMLTDPAQVEPPLVVPVTNFAPEPFDVLQEFKVVVRADGEGAYIASHFDGNISTSGDTPEEAVDNLKGFMLDLFEDYDSEPPERLGPAPAKQLAVLKTIIGRRGGDGSQ